jgi:hypothetical protein
MLSDFKLKILTQLYEAKKEDGPTLFNQMGLKWTNVGSKQCPSNTHLTKENFNECIRDYLEAVAGFSNIGNQLIC